MVATGKILAACMMLASQTYDIPPAVLVGIYKVEGGKIGQAVENTNGSFDLGPMQINTIWVPMLSKKWGVSDQTTARWLRDDACTNIGVSAWILRTHLDETQSLTQAIAHYHSRTPKHGTPYREKVLSILRDKGLIKEGR